MAWNNVGFFNMSIDGGFDDGGGNGGGNYINIIGLTSKQVLSWMGFGDRVGRMKGEVGIWQTSITVGNYDYENNNFESITATSMFTAFSSAEWLSASNMFSYAGGAQAIYEKGIFSRHKFEYKPSKGPNAGKWTTLWKTNKAGELVGDINALPEESYLVLKNSRNALAKYNLGKTVSRAGKVLGALGMFATIADGLDESKGGWKSHHTADLIIGAAMTFGPVGWIGGLTFLAADLITQGVTNKSITENLFD